MRAVTADGMERRSPEDEDDAGGGAEQAFEALRAEVAALRRGVELVHRQMQQGTGQQSALTAAAPDYSPTLGAIARELKAVGARLGVIEGTPALASTPVEQADRAAAAAAPGGGGCATRVGAQPGAAGRRGGGAARPGAGRARVAGTEAVALDGRWAGRLGRSGAADRGHRHLAVGCGHVAGGPGLRGPVECRAGNAGSGGPGELGADGAAVQGVPG